jgi:hypothetical protein
VVIFIPSIVKVVFIIDSAASFKISFSFYNVTSRLKSKSTIETTAASEFEPIL